MSNLRIRIIGPLIVVAGIASLLVTISSWRVGQSRIQSELTRRFSTIRETVNQTNYPLTQSVLNSLAGLTDTEWITLNGKGQLILSTLTLDQPGWDRSSSEILPQLIDGPIVNDFFLSEITIELAGRSWIPKKLVRQSDSISTPPTIIVIVLFDQASIRASVSRAAIWPLLTGLSTVAAITLLMLFVSSRIINRIRNLQEQVEILSIGNFETRLTDHENDELGRLAQSINRMAEQLNQLWKKIHQQQRAKLLHQVAGGMAHQLRNTLTGARMAMELHSESCQSDRREEVDIALQQLEVAESYVKRLTLVGSGKQQPTEPRTIKSCLDDLKSTHRSIAEHLQVGLTWDLDQLDPNSVVENGSLFTAAISNLILNAIQASQHVSVLGKNLKNDLVEIKVMDDGEGIPAEISEDFFEPFSTTKPEGMGLGLALVQQTANQLGGSVDYFRQNDHTVFSFRCNRTKND